MKKQTRTLLFAAAGVGAIVLTAMVVRRGMQPITMAGGPPPLPGGLQPITLTDPKRSILSLPPAEDFSSLLAAMENNCGCNACTDNAISTITRPTIRETAYMPPQTYLNDYMLTSSEREALNNGTAELVLDDVSAAGYSIQSMLAPLDYMPGYMVLPRVTGGDLFNINAAENAAGDVELMQ